MSKVFVKTVCIQIRTDNLLVPICVQIVCKSYQQICNSYTIGCLPVCRDSPRALVSGLSYVQVDNYGITILYHLHQCRPCISEIFRA